jgi:hypothetical protein
VDKAMAKDPMQRYQRGMDMAFDLEDLREGREPRSRAREWATPAPVASGHEHAEIDPDQSTLQKKRPLQEQIEFIRRHSFVAALVVGLAVLALGVSHAFWHKAAPKQNQSPRSVAQAPAVGEVAVGPIAPKITEPGSQPFTPPTPSPRPASRAVPPRTPPEKKILVTRASATPPKIKDVNLTSASPALAVSPATLEIDVEYKFSQAKLTLWIDDRASFTHTLEGTDKKVLGVFHRSEGHEFHALQIPAGNHQLRVEVGGGAPIDQSATISANFASGDEKMLHVTFDKHGQMALGLENDLPTQLPPKAP